jgi:hypothetical protein
MAIVLTDDAVDIADLIARGLTLSTLHVLIPRGKNEQWLVAHAPLDLGARVQWGPVRDGDYVYIPIIPYRTHPDANKAIKYAITLGLRAGLDSQPVPGRDLRRLHLVTGTITEDLSDSGEGLSFRFYLGVAIQIH